MNKQDTAIIERTAKALKESDLNMECIIGELNVIYLTGKAAEALERLEEFRKGALLDEMIKAV